jgi:hypothetical protein
VFGEYVRTTDSLDARNRVFVTKVDGNTGALIYSTYLEKFGQTATGTASDIKVDAQGHAVVIGTSDSIPTTLGAYIPSAGNSGGAFLTKFSANAQSLVFSTLIGGDSGDSLALDSDGNIYAAGAGNDQFHPRTTFSTTPGAYAASPVSGNATISKFDASGNVIFATYFPGSSPLSIALDAGRNIVAAGIIGGGLPVSGGSYQQAPLPGLVDDSGFVATLSASGSSLTASTYFGDTPSRVRVRTHSGGTVTIVFYTSRSSLPVASPIQSQRLDNTFASGSAFVARFDNSLSSLLFGTYYAPMNPIGFTLDNGNNVLLTGFAALSNQWLKGNQAAVYNTGAGVYLRINSSLSPPLLTINSYYPSATQITTDTTGYRDKVVFRGNGFQTGLSIMFGNVSAGTGFTPTGGGTQVYCTVPPHLAGRTDITLTNPDNSSVTLQNAFEYGVSYPIVTSISPGTIDSNGGNIAVHGTDFPLNPPIMIAGTLAHGVNGGTSTGANCGVTAIAHVTTSQFVSVPDPRNGIDNYQRAQISLMFQQSASPTITQVTPAGGPTGGGTSVTIKADQGRLRRRGFRWRCVLEERELHRRHDADRGNTTQFRRCWRGHCFQSGWCCHRFREFLYIPRPELDFALNGLS